MIANPALLLLLLWVPPIFGATGILESISGQPLEGEIVFLPDGNLQVQKGEKKTHVPISQLQKLQLNKNPPGLPMPGRGNGLLGTYFDAINFSGAKIRRIDPTINFDWESEPAPGIEKDHFSVRWEGQLEAPTSGVFTFHLQADDGGRVWLNQQLLCERLTNQEAPEVSATFTLEALKKYDLRVECYEVVGHAHARLLWSHFAIPKSIIPKSQLFTRETNAGAALVPHPRGVLGLYFDNVQLEGEPLTRYETNIFFDWKEGSTFPSFAHNPFSARWLAKLRAPLSERFIFLLEGDDGVRLWLNDRLLIDEWQGGPLTAVSPPMVLNAGTFYDLKVEMLNRTGKASAKLKWSSQTIPMSPISAEFLVPSGQAIAPQGEISPLVPVGVRFWEGSFAKRSVMEADESMIKFGDEHAPQTVSLIHASTIIFRSVAASHLAAFRERSGLLLSNGDFIDGELKSITGGILELKSGLFGTRSFNLATEVVALLIRPESPDLGVFEIKTSDGSVFRARSFRGGKNILVLDLAGLGTYPIPISGLEQITRTATNRAPRSRQSK